MKRNMISAIQQCWNDEVKGLSGPFVDVESFRRYNTSIVQMLGLVHSAVRLLAKDL